MWHKSSLHLTVQKSWKFMGNIQHILGKVQFSAIVLNFMQHVLHSLNPRLSHCKIMFLNKKVKATVFNLRCALVQSSFRQGRQSCRDNMDLCMFAFLQSQKCNGFLPAKNTLRHLFSLRGFFVEGTSLSEKQFLMMPHQGLTVTCQHISCENDILLIYYGKRVFKVMYQHF